MSSQLASSDERRLIKRHRARAPAPARPLAPDRQILTNSITRRIPRCARHPLDFIHHLQHLNNATLSALQKVALTMATDTVDEKKKITIDVHEFVRTRDAVSTASSCRRALRRDRAGHNMRITIAHFPRATR